MIVVYPNGESFLKDNLTFLEKEPDLTGFFRMDAPLVTRSDRNNYVAKAEKDGRRLVVTLQEPYSMLVYGDGELTEELFGFLIKNGYRLYSLLGSTPLCEKIAETLKEKFGICYYEHLGMDFMECTEITEPTDPDVEIPCEADLDELYECTVRFIADCGLNDRAERDQIAAGLRNYRIVRADGKIAAMAKKAVNQKIAAVYTRPEYRGKGFARKVVNCCKNELIASEGIAKLNVDRKNPISNHLYRSLGFASTFSQGEWRRKS
ncbi:MAG: GNAT family N-acetyltransferase [Clostridiales bacterium]|nr:GNAT family N-acetyltransferase [Candidatus Coliplasma caballi]